MFSNQIETLVYKGDIEGVKELLLCHDQSPIEFEREPYTAIQKKKQAAALTVVMDDPRFVFDDIFVGRMFYFSTGLTMQTIWRHPKMKRLLETNSTMSDCFNARYPTPTWKQMAGIGQRFFQADNAIRYLQKEDVRKKNQRLAFSLVPALSIYIQRWKKNRSLKS